MNDRETERVTDAKRMFKRWRDRTKTIVLLVGAVVGIGAFPVGYYGIRELQFWYNEGVSYAMLNTSGGLVAWILVFIAADWLAGVIIKDHGPAKLDELARAHDVPVERLSSSESP